MWLLLPGLLVLYYFTIRGKGAYGASELAAPGDAALCDRIWIDGQTRLVYKPENQAGILNALLTKGVISKPAGSDMHTHGITELGKLAPAESNAYLFAMLAHAQAGGPQIWVTPTLTDANNKNVRFLYWGDSPPSMATPMALLVGPGQPWPGRPPVAALPTSDGGTYPLV